MLIPICCVAVTILICFTSTLLLFQAKSQTRKYYNAAEKIVREDLLAYSLKNPYTMPRGLKAPASVRLMLGMEILTVKPRQQRVFDISQPVNLGRSDQNHIVLHDMHISSRQGRIFARQGRIWLENLSTQCGMLVRRGRFQKIPVVPRQTIQLLDGDRICVNQHKLRVKIFVFNLNQR